MWVFRVGRQRQLIFPYRSFSQAGYVAGGGDSTLWNITVLNDHNLKYYQAMVSLGIVIKNQRNEIINAPLSGQYLQMR